MMNDKKAALPKEDGFLCRVPGLIPAWVRIA